MMKLLFSIVTDETCSEIKQGSCLSCYIFFLFSGFLIFFAIDLFYFHFLSWTLYFFNSEIHALIDFFKEGTNFIFKRL